MARASIRLTIVSFMTVVLVACSGGSSGGTGAPASGDVDGDADTGQTDFELPSFELPAGPTMRPSGAQVRVIDLYRDADGAGVPIDVYTGFAVQPGAAPLVSVPYATASDWFDPLVFDESGDAQVSFFPQGQSDADHELGNQTETFAGGERISIFLASGENLNPSGDPFGAWRTIFESESSMNPLPTPLAGGAVVIVDELALDHVPAFADGYLYASVGDGCLLRLAAESYEGPQPLSPGATSAFEIPSGSQTLSFHADGVGCADAPTLSLPLQLAAGQRTYVLLHSPDGTSIEALLVPIDS